MDFYIIFLYFSLVIFGLILPVLICLFGLFNVVGDIFGAPFVPTNAKIVDEILQEASLKKGQVFYELGCGDGRLVREAAIKYQVKAIGIDIHPLLILYSKIISVFTKLNNTDFITADFFKLNYSDADVLFMFLLPKSLTKLRQKIKRECKKGTLVISHGFQIESWDNFLVKKVSRKLFPTYYYKIK